MGNEKFLYLIKNLEEAGHLRFVTNTEIKWFFKKDCEDACYKKLAVKTNFCGNNGVA